MVDQQKSGSRILKPTAPLFYLCRFVGCLPFSFMDFMNHHQLKRSVPGILWCLFCIAMHSAQYQIGMNNSLKDNWGGETNTLTSVIGIFIVFMEPLMMTVSVLVNIFYQSTFINCIHRLAKVDERLLLITAKSSVDDAKVRRLTLALLLATCVCELGLVLFNFLQFKISDDILFQTYWWIVSGVPIFCDALARIWYIVLMYFVKLRIENINSYCFELQRALKVKRERGDMVSGMQQDATIPTVSIGYLGQEIVDPKKRSTKKVLFVKSNKIHSPPQRNPKGGSIFVTPTKAWDSPYAIDDKMDKKLIELARIHDELCEVAKTVNKIFSLQILLTMAYGFMAVTAQLYFLYCGLVGQVVPVLFRSAESIPISLTYICYTSAKCVSVIFVSWKTKLESQKTGIHIHKLANVVDENHFYHVANHLSLKLLNNQLTLTACGFFDLDMTTIYAITGAITSYLIILIQFNLAGNKNRNLKVGGGQGNQTATMLNSSTINGTSAL